MRSVEELLSLARDCYAQARLTSNRLAKTELTTMGDDYLKQAEKLQHTQVVVRAAFPKPDKIG